MPFAMKKNVSFNPTDISLLGANAVCGRVVTLVTGYPPAYPLRVNASSGGAHAPGRAAWAVAQDFFLSFQRC